MKARLGHLKARRRSHESPASVRGLGRRCSLEWGESSAVCILNPKPATSAPGPACRARVLQRGVQRADARARGNLHHGLVDLPAAVPPAAGQAGAAHHGLCFPFGIYGPAAPSRRGYWVISHCARSAHRLLASSHAVCVWSRGRGARCGLCDPLALRSELSASLLRTRVCVSAL